MLPACNGAMMRNIYHQAQAVQAQNRNHHQYHQYGGGGS
ncbi:hypothetical protein BLA29_014459, partial [Euroglyphus maynei]